MADFVIIGAGSAGCVLADRLSARADVLLLEAGGSDRVNEVRIPAAFSKLFNTRRDWAYETDPEPHAHGRSLYLPRGKMIGGSSSMNSMLYIRGRPADYDAWARQAGDEWAWDEVLRVFRAMEGNSRGADDYHGASGPVLVEDQRNPNTLSRVFVEAAIQAGMPPNHDFNGPTQVGAGFFQVTQKRGRRWSAADAFLRPAMSRPTLEVIPNATVLRVLFNSGKAVGVEYMRNGVVERASAGTEVIISAGSFGSPHLLQMSGVGDSEHLAGLGVDVVADSPEVGENLADHPVVGVMYDSLRSGTLDDSETAAEILNWFTLRNGRLTSPVAEACAFTASTTDVEDPDLQFHFGPASFDDHGRHPYPGHAFTFGPVLVNPRSKGRLRAVSSDPTRSPSIRTNVLADPADLAALSRGIEIARDIAAQPAMDRYRGVEIRPGPGVTTGQEIEDFVRGRVELLYHPVGTCRMGDDAGAVVDGRLRVQGVERLRVIDASIMPSIVSGNTNAPTLMIADRGAQMILEDHAA